MRKEATVKELRIFSALMATAGTILVLVGTVHKNTFPIILGGCFVLTVLIAQRLPSILRRLYDGWMFFSRSLGWVNTSLLLTLLYYGVITPIALAMRFTGKRPLEITAFDSQDSTWRDCALPEKDHWRRMY